MSPRGLLDPADSKWDRQVTLSYGVPPVEHTHTTYNADSLERLQRSAKALDLLLIRARKKDLPAVAWHVNAHAITAEWTTGDSLAPDDKRAMFMAWADELRAEWKERTHASPGGPVIELRGRAEIPAPNRPHLTVVIGLSAEWYVAEDPAT